jgi:hypothetical protein
MLGVGVLALAMTQGQQAKAQFAWSARYDIVSDDPGDGIYTSGPGALNSVSMIQATPGTYGTAGNYELVVGLGTGGLGHFYRDNDDPSQPWYGPVTFATDQGACSGVSLIQSNFSTQFANTGTQGPGNLAVVANFNGTLQYYFREDVTFTWSSPTTITTGAYGIPSFVQAKPGTYGTTGNYELVTPLTTGGLMFFYRDNDDPSQPWIPDPNGAFATGMGIFQAVSLIQSSFSTQFQNTGTQGPGNLALVARAGDDLYYFYREDVTFTWSSTPVNVADEVFGGPSFVQALPGTYGTVGNYELVVPSRLGGILVYYRDNDDPSQPWNGPTATFGTDLGIWQGTSIIQTTFSSELQNTGTQGPGNLAVAAVSVSELSYFYRADY